MERRASASLDIPFIDDDEDDNGNVKPYGKEQKDGHTTSNLLIKNHQVDVDESKEIPNKVLNLSENSLINDLSEGVQMNENNFAILKTPYMQI